MAATAAPVTPAAGGTPPYGGKPLRRGSSGDSVRVMQQRLSDLGYALSVDGMFGPGTQKAITDFQQTKGLSADGVAGPATWAALWA